MSKMKFLDPQEAEKLKKQNCVQFPGTLYKQCMVVQESDKPEILLSAFFDKFSPAMPAFQF